MAAALVITPAAYSSAATLAAAGVALDAAYRWCPGGAASDHTWGYFFRILAASQSPAADTASWKGHLKRSEKGALMDEVSRTI